MTLRIACLGDSLTRAQFSVDYLDLLERRHPPGDVRPARFGANGDFAHNLLRRLDAVVTDPPDVITVLIGTNDARASLAGYPVDQAQASQAYSRMIAEVIDAGLPARST
ncbi:MULTISPECIES: SGNH/GDSL hydrolase family protein [Streptomyces]|uniref:SGNH/GDSL hydrolase family protein n=1 Tax=Streptomyces TaxID=1883 RepID=UPI000A871F61